VQAQFGGCGRPGASCTRFFYWAAAFVIALTTPAAAQGTVAGQRPTAADHRPLLGGGLSFLTDGEETGTGLAVDFSKALFSSRRMSIAGAGDFGWHHFDGFTSMSFMGGARVAVTGSARFAPFGQFLIGPVRFSTSFCDGEDCNETDLAFAPGGGIDIRMTGGLNLRAQVDFFFIRFGDGTENATRFTFGISMPIGK
jgi:hypothetical protein